MAATGGEMRHDILNGILKDSGYALRLFSDKEKDALRGRIFFKTVRKKELAFVRCVIRDRDIQLKPEEVVRQLYASRLMEHYGYGKNRIVFEYPVPFGREKKNAAIVIVDGNSPDTPYCIVELKKPLLKDGKNQLKSYCNATGAPIGVWTNGEQISHYHRKDSAYFEAVTDIPTAGQTLEDIIGERFTLRDLFLKDTIANGRKTLKGIILEMEDEVLANAGVDVFEEVFKLIFTKLYDEFCSEKDRERIASFLDRALAGEDRGNVEKIKKCLETLDDSAFRAMAFRNRGQTDSGLKQDIQALFDAAKREWKGVFADGETFALAAGHLAVCVASLQDIKLFNANLLVIDEAFEYLINKSAKGEKGQYFTPRHVIDMCVRMLNPRRGEYMIDTASGSCGFPAHTIFQLTGNLFAGTKIREGDKQDIQRVFGIDFDERTVRIARTMNLIAGNGETNVLFLNTLDYDRWPDKTEKDPRWVRTYGKPFERLAKLRRVPGSNKEFAFDLLMANPPFAGDIKESRLLHCYEFGFKAGGKKAQTIVSRDILFIERNIDFLKPGGRMAIVLPQGRCNNTTDKYIRDYIADKARILAVVGLHPNTFRPHTGIKTSVLFVQKWDAALCPRVDDYPIFFAVSENGGKNNSGDYIYVKNDEGQYTLDRNGSPVVEHDLHNHGGLLPDGIAEAFIAWAKREKLSFWVEG